MNYWKLASVLEEFLYTREFSLAQPVFNLKMVLPKQKTIDQEVMNRFSFVNSQPQRKMLTDNLNKLSRSTQINNIAECKIRRATRTFYIKPEGDLQMFEVNRKKQSHIRKYRENAHQSAMGNRRHRITKKSQQIILIEEEETPVKQPEVVEVENVEKPKEEAKEVNSSPVKNDVFVQFIGTIVEQPPTKGSSVSTNNPHINGTNGVDDKHKQQTRTSIESQVATTQVIRLKLVQKLQLALQNGKVKNVNQYGQVFLQGHINQKVLLYLISDLWHNKNVVMTRLTPNSLKINPLSDSRFEVELTQDCKSKGVIDYIILKETFNQDKIPLIFIYNEEAKSRENCVQFIFKYKVNERWKEPLYDIEIQIVLDSHFIFSDCKTTPMANSLQGKKVLWKAKQLAENAKGKLSLVFIDGNMQGRAIIKGIHITMKSEKSLIKDLDVSCESSRGKQRAKRNLTVEYKILPN